MSSPSVSCVYGILLANRKNFLIRNNFLPLHRRNSVRKNCNSKAYPAMVKLLNLMVKNLRLFNAIKKPNLKWKRDDKNEQIYLCRFFNRVGTEGVEPSLEAV
jgi:hypothetical protein